MLFIKTYVTGVNEYNQKWVILNAFYVCLMQPATYDKWKRRAHSTKVFITWIFLRLLWNLLKFDLTLKMLLKGSLKNSVDDYDAMNRTTWSYHFVEIVPVTRR